VRLPLERPAFIIETPNERGLQVAAVRERSRNFFNIENPP
jgi:hypothetical protein